MNRKSNYSRFLGTNKAVEEFLEVALQLDYNSDRSLKKKNIITKIVDGELGIANFKGDEHTLSSKDMRDAKYRDDDVRWTLREQIIDELITKERLENDEKICLKKGGALPLSGVVSEKQAFILIGLPASGKSGIATKIAEDNGAIIIDSDFVKRKLPEYKSHLYSASIVHEESSQMCFGFRHDNPGNVKSLYELCIERGNNIIIPRIGQNPVGITDLAKSLRENQGYEVHLILVSLPKREATIRAIYRFAQTGRYVPLGLIFDVYGNDPSYCYYYLRAKHESIFKSLGVVETLSKSPQCLDYKGDSPALKYKFKDVILQLP